MPKKECAEISSTWEVAAETTATKTCYGQKHKGNTVFPLSFGVGVEIWIDTLHTATIQEFFISTSTGSFRQCREYIISGAPQTSVSMTTIFGTCMHGTILKLVMQF